MSATTSQAANIAEFSGAKAKETSLRVRGFDPKTGARSGGIRNPLIVRLLPGTVVIRLYHDPARRFGEWWWTPHEMNQIIDYFGRSGAAFGEGRTQGKGILHATLAVRHDWAGANPDHLGLLNVIRMTRLLEAYYGEGDVAPNAAQDQTLKPVQITDEHGRRRGCRQLFLPGLWNYQSAFVELQQGLSSDVDLTRIVRQYLTGPLPFEI